MQPRAGLSVVSPTIWDTSPGEALLALPWKGTAGWGALGAGLTHSTGSAGPSSVTDRLCDRGHVISLLCASVSQLQGLEDWTESGMADVCGVFSIPLSPAQTDSTK